MAWVNASIALSLLLSAAPLTGKGARTLAMAGRWDELLVTASAADAVRPRDAAEVGLWLARGCQALLRREPALAFGLGQRAADLHDGVDTELCLARAALATSQPDAAEESLKSALRRYGGHAALATLLGQVLLDQKELEPAVRVLASIRRPGLEARHLLARARAQVKAEQKRRLATLAQERALERREKLAARSGAAASLTYESGTGPGDLRTRTNARFAIKYFNNRRDFGQRADYETRVVSALDEAHDFAEGVLGRARSHAVDVVLYTKDEFRLHFGESMSRSVAGLYSDNAIRINGAAELDPNTKATLVHEYVHAVVDEVTNGHAARIPTWLSEGVAEFVEWKYLGSDRPPLGLGAQLQTAVRAHALPSLSSLSRGPLVAQADPALTYAESAVAVRLLFERGGAPQLLALCRDLGAGRTFESALQKSYGLSVGSLQAQLEDELAHR